MFRGFSCRGPEQHFLGYYIFLIARYRRTSGSDLNATSPSATAAAAMAIVVTYPSVRIIFLLLFDGPAAAARHIDVPHSGAAGLLTWLSSSVTAADEVARLRITACKKAATSRG
jgi:hypothetical protein